MSGTLFPFKVEALQETNGMTFRFASFKNAAQHPGRACSDVIAALLGGNGPVATVKLDGREMTAESDHGRTAVTTIMRLAVAVVYLSLPDDLDLISFRKYAKTGKGWEKFVADAQFLMDNFQPTTEEHILCLSALGGCINQTRGLANAAGGALTQAIKLAAKLPNEYQNEFGPEALRLRAINLVLKALHGVTDARLKLPKHGSADDEDDEE